MSTLDRIYDWLGPVYEFNDRYGMYIVAFILGLLVMRLAWHFKHPEDFCAWEEEEDPEEPPMEEIDHESFYQNCEEEI